MTPLQSICFNIFCSLRRFSERSQRKYSIYQMVVQVNTRPVRTCATILWTLDLKLNGICCHFTRQGAMRWCGGGFLKRMATKASLQIRSRHVTSCMSLQSKLFPPSIFNTSVGHWEAEGNCLRATLQRC